MKRIAIAAIAMLTLAAAAHAEGPMGGLGFHSTNAPIGVRQWFTDKFGVDLGVGFTSDGFKNKTPNAPTFDNASSYFVDLGLPYVCKRWEKVNFVVRPGFEYGSLKDNDGVDSNVKKANQWGITGEFEVELMLAEKVSISASHGVGFFQFTDESNPNDLVSTRFTTTGDNFTALGFHVYLW